MATPDNLTLAECNVIVGIDGDVVFIGDGDCLPRISSPDEAMRLASWLAAWARDRRRRDAEMRHCKMARVA